MLGASSTAPFAPSLKDLLARLHLLAAKFFAAADRGTPLTVGAKGTDVWALQVFLVSGVGSTSGSSTGGGGVGTGSSGAAAHALADVGPTGYFGKLTTNALKEYQEQEKIAPVAGCVGPKTRAAIAAAAKSDILLPST